MRIGVPKEIKNRENRVGLNPESVAALVADGHELFVETQAGQGIGADDTAYQEAGARIVPNADAVFEQAELIIKVKEPQKQEWERLTPDHILFTYLHLAPDPDQAHGLMNSGCTAIAYETVTDDAGRLPLLTPMSAIAGRMAPQMAAFYAQGHYGGHGLLACGVEGVSPARIVIIGGGVSGQNAAMIATGLGMDVVLLDRGQEKLKQLAEQFPQAQLVDSTAETIRAACLDADIVIGAVLIPGAAAPKLVGRDLIRDMKPGSVVVDIAIDQGGCVETARPTTHDDPVYIVDDVVHYCVANMPGAYPQTATAALNLATLPYIQRLAGQGLAGALSADRHLQQGVNVYREKIVNKAVAEALELPYNPSGFQELFDS